MFKKEKNGASGDPPGWKKKEVVGGIGYKCSARTFTFTEEFTLTASSPDC